MRRKLHPEAAKAFVARSETPRLFLASGKPQKEKRIAAARKVEKAKQQASNRPNKIDEIIGTTVQSE